MRQASWTPFHTAMHQLGSVIDRAMCTPELSCEAAALGALIAVISRIRAEGLNEAALLKEARAAVPVRHQTEYIHTVLQ